MQTIPTETLIPSALLDLSRANYDVGGGSKYRQIGTIDPAEVTVEEMHEREEGPRLKA